MVTACTKMKRSQVKDLFDAANSNDWISKSNQWRYVHHVFQAPSESEMLRYAPYKDDGERPGCICLRSDLNQALQLTKVDRASGASWTAVDWITISTTRPNIDTLNPGDIWFLRNTNPQYEPINLTGWIKQWNRGQYEWMSWENNLTQFKRIREFTFSSGQYVVNDAYDAHKIISVNNLACHTDHKYIVTGDIESNGIEIGNHSSVSLVATSNDESLIVSAEIREVPMVAYFPLQCDKDNASAFGAFHIHDSDNSTAWSLDGTFYVEYVKINSNVPLTLTFRIESIGYSVEIPFIKQVGNLFTHTGQITIANLHRGRYDWRVDFTEGAPTSWTCSRNYIFLSPCIFKWQSNPGDGVRFPILHSTQTGYEFKILPTFKSAKVSLPYDRYIGHAPEQWIYFEQLPSLKAYATVPANTEWVLFANLPVTTGIAKTQYVRHPDPIFSYAYPLMTATAGLSNDTALRNIIVDGHSLYSQLPQADQNFISVSNAVQSINEFRLKVNRHDFNEGFQETFGREAFGAAQSKMVAVPPYTIWMIQAHRVPQRDPAVLEYNDDTIIIEVLFYKDHTLDVLHQLTIPAHKSSSDPYYPDWINFSNCMIYWRVIYPDDSSHLPINLEVIMAHSNQGIGYSLAFNEFNQIPRVEEYNQTLKQLQQEPVYDRYGLNVLVGV